MIVFYLQGLFVKVFFTFVKVMTYKYTNLLSANSQNKSGRINELHCKKLASIL